MNIKIGKGGSGKINSTKGGTSKLNQKKYIDLLPAVSIPAIDTTDGLIAFWDLDNVNGLSTIPASYGSFTLNTYGGYSSVNGKIKNGFEFADDSQGLWTNEQLWNLLTNPTSFSVSYWIKLPNVSSVTTLMGNAFGNLGFHFDYINDDSFYGGSNYGFTMNMSTVGGPYAWERTFAKEFAVANQWYHIVGTYDYPTTTMRLYVNGVLKDTNTGATIGENSLPDVGGFAVNGSVLDGEKEYGTNQIYDAIGFWNKALNQNEISSLYNNGNGKQFSTAYNLTFLFDPIFYKSQIAEGIQNDQPNKNQNDPVYLNQIRDYQFDNTIPNLGFNPLTWQVIPDTAQGTTKAEIKNNMYSYIKYADNSDVEFKNYRKQYSSINKMQLSHGVNPPKDNRKGFLLLRKNNNGAIYNPGKSSTLNYFIRLQRPVSHKNPNSGFIVREKRGTYLTSYANEHEHISFGYRSPYYNITGRPSYKGIFNNFSFVFSFGKVNSAFSGPFSRPYNFTLMTDYKFNFGEVYFISIVSNSGTISIYINGEIQTVARLPFNPLINRTKKPLNNATYYAARINESPLGPGFYKKDGTLYSSAHIGTSFSGCPQYDLNYLLFGNSKMTGRVAQNAYSRCLKRKRHLNNLDIGVITTYNTALSQSQISEIYNNFRYRYI